MTVPGKWDKASSKRGRPVAADRPSNRSVVGGGDDTSTRFGRWRRRTLIMVAGGVAVVVVAAVLLVEHNPRNGRVCERQAGAEVCLVVNGPAYRIEGNGFVPGDDVHIKFTGEDPFFLRADAAGRVPGSSGSVAGFLPGERPSLVTVFGNGASGEAVYIELPVCGRTASGRAVC